MRHRLKSAERAIEMLKGDKLPRTAREDRTRAKIRRITLSFWVGLCEVELLSLIGNQP